MLKKISLSILLLSPLLLSANPKPFELEINKSTINDLNNKYSSEYIGMNQYSEGKMFKININELQIGTQATRPSIIERLKNLDFINLHKNKYIPTEKGLNYYEIFKDLEVSNVCTTALWELDLKNIADGTSDDIKFYQNINSFTKKIVEDIFSKNFINKAYFLNQSCKI